MSASLVGSEMCIRDSASTGMHTRVRSHTHTPHAAEAPATRNRSGWTCGRFLFTQRRNTVEEFKELGKQQQQQVRHVVGGATSSAERRSLLNPSAQAVRPAESEGGCVTDPGPHPA
eukprot:9612587-Alexandrium_andersonii.AAC.1